MFFSLDFLLVYLPLILLGFAIIKRTLPAACSIYLVALLYLALYYIDITSFALVFATSTVNYLLVRKIQQQKSQKWLVVTGVICALLPLILFKFAPSLFRYPNSDASILFTVGIPIGLSFYALQQITALIDCRKDPTLKLPYHKHMLYLGFFPNFIAGPVFPYRDAVGAIGSLGYKPVPEDWIGNGLLLFLVGLSKKLWIADPIGGAIDKIISGVQNPDTSMTLFEAWFVVWGFLVQLYFDFSAYSDMAIGLALCFGVLLPMNFDSPLKSFSAHEYIARWHISFTGFVRTYFFIPMLSLLKKLPIENTEKKMTISWAVGLFSSYIIIGIWHAPNLVVMVSSTLAICMLFLIKIPSLLANRSIQNKPVNKARKYVNRCLLLLFSMLMAICLKIQDVELLQKIYGALVQFDNISLPDYMKSIVPSFAEHVVTYTGIAPQLSSYQFGELVFTRPAAYFLTLAVATVIIFFSPNSMSIFGIKNSGYQTFFKQGTGIRFYLLFSLLFFTAIFALVFEGNQIQNFIYERF